MSAKEFKSVLIIGLGLIGSSLIRAVKEYGLTEKIFGLDICFTPPYSHKILYNKANFSKWFDDNKLPGLYTENQYIRAQLKHLNKECDDLIARGKRLGHYADGRKRKR